jgi:hypothetical protein
MKFNKWNTWRIINSIVIFFSFFAPFAVMEWGIPKDISHALTFNGFKMLDYHQHMASYEIFMEGREFFERIRVALADSQHFLGLYTILFYCMASLLLAIFKPNLFKKPIWAMLALCLIALGLRNLWIILALDTGWKALSNALVGYWLVLIGLTSAIILETGYHFSRRI